MVGNKECQCKEEALCGICSNGFREVSEECDVGKNENLGCINCKIQRGYICEEIEEGKDNCFPNCGDGILIGNELCDAG